MSAEKISEKLQACQRLEREGALDFAAALPMAAAASSAIMSAWRQKAEPPREAVALLCELATASDAAVQQVGVETLFAQVVERLNDSFSHSACAFYDQLFAQVISGCRQLPAGAVPAGMRHSSGSAMSQPSAATRAR